MVDTIALESASYAPIIYDTRLVYANYAAMIADTTMTAVQVGKLGLIDADNSVWRLEQITPCIKWKLFSGESVSRSDETIYVNWDTGNDSTGNGSIAHPYKTFAFVEGLPRTIKDHTIRIKASASNSYNVFPKDGIPNTVGSGRLIFDSSSETFPVYAGPYTVSTVTNVGGAAHFGVSHATDLTVTGAGWTVDDFYGKSIRMLTGLWAGYVLYIHKNTSDTITTIADWYGFAPGDTFEIVDRPIVITVDHPITFNSNSTMHRYTSDTTPDTPFEPSILFCGYKFSSSSKNPFRFDNINAIFSACTFWGQSTDVNSINLNASHFSFNFDDIPTDSFDVAVFEDFYAFDWKSIPLNGNPVQPAALPCFQAYGPGYVSQLSMRGEMRSEKALGHFQSYGCQVGKGSFIDSGTGTHEYIYVEQVGYDTPSFVVDNNQAVSIVSAYCKHYEGGLSVKSSKVYISWLQGEDPLVGTYGADIGAGSLIVVPDSSNVTLTGPLGAIIIKYPSNDVFANWPGTGVTHTNSIYTTHVIGDNTL